MQIQRASSFDIHPEDSRLTTLPIHRQGLWEWYKDAVRCFWVTEDVSCATDVLDYAHKLTKSEQHFVKYILAFFAASDGIVNINITKRFKEDVPIFEAGYFYDYQTMMENIHAEMYSIMLESIIPSQQERDDLRNAIYTMPIIAKISDYMYGCINSEASFAERCLQMACVEGILFTGCFCVIYWLQNRGLMPALGQSNESIAKDEALHTMFALTIYNLQRPECKLGANRVHEIMDNAVKLAKEFINLAIPAPMTGMNANLMSGYIECQADNLMTLIDIPLLYNTKHEFHFMEQINLTNRSNFFERKVVDYAKKKQASKGYNTAVDF